MALAALARRLWKGSSLLAGLTVLAVLAVVFATFGLPQAGAATRPGAVRFIDTHRIIGLPRQLAAVAQTGTVPTITTQPLSESVVTGSTASFSAAASGSPTPTVHWQVSTNHGSSWTNAAAAASTTLSFTTSPSMNGNQYRAVFTNSAGSATSAVAILTVRAVPTTVPIVTTQPVSESVVTGSTATFSAAANGSPVPTVHWQVSTNHGSVWTNIASATSTTYSFTATTSANGNEYRAVFSNSAGSATTTAATLTVTTPPSPPAVLTQPQSQTVASGASALFSAAASGSPSPTIQWMISTDSGSTWTAIGSATSTTYSFTTSTSQSGNQYEAVFTNPSGSATTTPATLTVNASVPTSAGTSTNWSGYADTGATFSAVSGSWTVPTVNCSIGQTAYSSQWIGIDGDGSGTVEQDGTEADCMNGSPSYDAWYEMYGDQAVNSGFEVELSPTFRPVAAGDTMSASVSVSGSTWTLAIADSTKGWSFSTHVNFSAVRSSAEWVVERPEICSSSSSSSCSLTSLAAFSSVTMSNASVSSTTVLNGAINSFSNMAIAMVGHTTLAFPSALSTEGRSFSDTWQGSS